MDTIWGIVRQLEGETLTTLRQSKRFKVTAVEENSVRVLPHGGTGSERAIARPEIEHMVNLGLGRDELRQRAEQEYPNSQNTSYLASIAYEVSTHAARTSHSATDPELTSDRPAATIFFEFVSGSEDATSARGSAIQREDTMVLDLTWEGTSYLIRGNRVNHYYTGHGSGVTARWGSLGDTFVGIWVEEGEDWFFRFRLPHR